jgi:hypothetical protein
MLPLSWGVAYAQVTSADYHLIGVIREIPTDSAVISDLNDGSTITSHEIVFEITKSSPPLWGGSILRVRYQGGIPAIGAHPISLGDTISFTLKKGRDPIDIEWRDIDAHM